MLPKPLKGSVCCTDNILTILSQMIEFCVCSAPTLYVGCCGVQQRCYTRLCMCLWLTMQPQLTVQLMQTLLVLTAPPHLVGTTLGSKPWAQAHPYCPPQHTSIGC